MKKRPAELKSVFKVSVAYNRYYNDVEIHLDKETAKKLCLYLKGFSVVEFESIKNAMIDLLSKVN